MIEQANKICIRVCNMQGQSQYLIDIFIVRCRPVFGWTPTVYRIADILFRRHDISKDQQNYRGITVVQSVEKIVVVSQAKSGCKIVDFS